MSEPLPRVSETFARVNYSETDQMGVVYHSRYLVWLDIARTEHLRRTGMRYADLERRGLRLAVGELRIRYRQPARYDEDKTLLVTAETSMMVLGPEFQWARLPDDVRELMPVAPDPVRLF
jgi:acyl-CoA thioester hydrolase